jgi:hypothetical protein
LLHEFDIHPVYTLLIPRFEMNGASSIKISIENFKNVITDIGFVVITDIGFVVNCLFNKIYYLFSVKFL